MEFFDTDNLIAHFLAALRETPDTAANIVQRDVGLGPSRADALVKAQIGGQEISFVVEFKRSAFPRDVREAAWQLRNSIAHLDKSLGQAIPMVVAEAISPGAKSLLREERIGYYDTGGSLFVPAHGAFLFIDRPIPKRQARSQNALFTGRRAQVLHAIWVAGRNWFGVHEIAQRAQVSPTTVSETLIALERREWVISRGSGPTKERRLADSQGLLDAWTLHQVSTRPALMRHYYVSVSTANDLIYRLDRSSETHKAIYAITGQAAAQSYAPYLSSISQVHCRLAVSSIVEAVLESMEARPVREGWNLGVIETKFAGEFAFRERIMDAWFAHPLQVYLDLLQFGGRSKEMAEHLRAEKLGA